MPSRKKLEPQINGFPYLGTGAGTDFGRKIFVDSNSAGASDNNPGTDIERPMASVFGSSGAITKTSSALVADRGDLIVCLPSHTETISAAQTISTSGLRIVGLGVGNNRPKFTYATSTAAAVTFGANDIEWTNCIHICNIASQVTMLDLGASADGARILDSEFREGSATGLLFIDISGVADDVKIGKGEFGTGCRFFAPTAGNFNAAIDIGAAVTRLEISDFHIYGDFDDAGIHNPIGAVATLLKIKDGTVTNLLTGQHAIELVSACTGDLVNLQLNGDTLGTILDPGSCRIHNVTESAAIDTPAVTSPVALTDSAANILGADNASNAFASTNVAEDLDGSIIERIEGIQNALHQTAGIAAFPAAAAAANAVSLAEVIRFISEQQTPRIASKASGDLTAFGTSLTLFTVTGQVLVRMMARVTTTTTSTSGTTTLSAGIAGNTALLLVSDAVDGTAFVANDCWTLDTAADAPGALVSAEYAFLGNGEDIILTASVDDITAGAITFYCQYIPLDGSSSVVAAA